MRTMGVTEEDKQRYCDLVEKYLAATSNCVRPHKAINKYHIVIEADLFSYGNMDDVRRGLNIEIDGTEENIKSTLYEVKQ